MQIKSNLGPIAEAVGYSIEQGQFRWTGATELTAGRMLAPEIEDSALGEAKLFLHDILVDGAREAKDVQEEAKAAGITSATLRRAKDTLTIKARKQDFEGPWLWELPQDAQP